MKFASLFSGLALAAIVVMLTSTSSATLFTKLPEERLSHFTGADGATPNGYASNCGDANATGDEVGNLNCEVPDDVCITCVNDTATSSMSAPNFNGYGYTLGDFQSCHGEYVTGLCEREPISGNIVCITDDWDDETYCDGEIQYSSVQTMGGDPGP